MAGVWQKRMLRSQRHFYSYGKRTIWHQIWHHWFLVQSSSSSCLTVCITQTAQTTFVQPSLLAVAVSCSLNHSLSWKSTRIILVLAFVLGHKLGVTSGIVSLNENAICCQMLGHTKHSTTVSVLFFLEDLVFNFQSSNILRSSAGITLSSLVWKVWGQFPFGNTHK